MHAFSKSVNVPIRTYPIYSNWSVYSNRNTFGLWQSDGIHIEDILWCEWCSVPFFFAWAFVVCCCCWQTHSASNRRMVRHQSVVAQCRNFCEIINIFPTSIFGCDATTTKIRDHQQNRDGLEMSNRLKGITAYAEWTRHSFIVPIWE